MFQNKIKTDSLVDKITTGIEYDYIIIGSGIGK